MNSKALAMLGAEETERCIPVEKLMVALSDVMREYEQGRVHCPERQVVPLTGGVMLSMPASAGDIAIHKLVNVTPENRGTELPTIHGVVMVYDAHTGKPLVGLDGGTVTGLRTAAVSMLGIQKLFKGTPSSFWVIGSGKQAMAHAQLLLFLYPMATLYLQGSSDASSRAFVERLGEPGRCKPVLKEQPQPVADVILTLTTSTEPVFSGPVKAGQLVVGVGAFQPTSAEVAPDVVHACQLVVDDLAGAKHEAGDLIRAGVDWSAVQSLASVDSRPLSSESPIFLKTVGCAAWDLAAGRVACQQLGML
ncbi:delta(1)-pyrroline-2-carboxylate reductase family protein [Leeia oryzae]|uniref:delta(1)-pyrroline-2-carboxylate reductase family protein n=1 Tax=Leeia oryzae TaxID=356662 RepID=UPI00037F3CBF|nr:delta(1)-pyrroline-2-carboxylate reductase family protein [Leeia oryzae]